MRSRLLLALFGCALLVSARSACAGPVFFTALADGGVGPIGADFQSTPQSVDTGVVENNQFGTLYSVGRATASADFGHVGGSSVIQSMQADTTAFQSSSFAIYEDFVTFSGPSGATSVSTSLNLTLAYDMSSTSGAGADLRLTAHINGVDSEYEVNVFNGGTPTVSSSSLSVSPSAALTFNGVATTQLVSVPIGGLVYISLLMETGAGATALGTGTVHADNSFDFVQGSDLFNLPDGYTVNSADSFIINNRFAPLTAAPEPSALVLGTIGLVSCIGLGRRRRNE